VRTRIRLRRAARPRLLLVAVAVSLTACGPTPPFELAVHAVPGDVAYGAQSTPSPSAAAGPGAAAPPPPGAPPLIYGAPAPPPATTFAPKPAATPAPTCATAPVDAVPALAADPSATVPPVPATYAWHEQGTYTLGGGAPLPFPPQLTHTVANVSAPDATGGYTFDVTSSAGGLTGLQQVTSSYQVIPPPQGTTDVQGASTSTAAGLYLTGMVAKDNNLPTARAARFTPPILLMQFPGTDLPSWNTAGTDSATGTTIKLSAAVTKHVSVDACGTVVDAWEVTASGTLVGPDQNLTLNNLTYDVATQFGGLIVRESDDVSGTETSGAAMQSVTSSVTATTSVVPQRRAS
jgi:hypothetical protein